MTQVRDSTERAAGETVTTPPSHYRTIALSRRRTSNGPARPIGRFGDRAMSSRATIISAMKSSNMPISVARLADSRKSPSSVPIGPVWSSVACTSWRETTADVLPFQPDRYSPDMAAGGVADMAAIEQDRTALG